MDETTNKPTVPPDAQAEACHGCGGDCSECAARSNLHAYNWLDDIPGGMNSNEMVEVTFKNTRRGFYRNTNNLTLHTGDLVAVEASPGHDIGRVSMTGRLVALQMKKANLKRDTEFLRVFRHAKPADIERWREAQGREYDTMVRSRKIAEELHLNMKIGDVEYQGDGSKAIFYYIADGRVDFRQLIKVLAETFHIRVEMKQIGARQEAGRIGGIGPCGRALCCASWMSNFVSVSTQAARFQDISPNPQKLAGQCAKLKCCLNFEVDAYAEITKHLPKRDVHLYTKDNTYYHFKTDIFKREMTYSTDKSMAANTVTISADRVKEIIELNRNGIKPDTLLGDGHKPEPAKKMYGDIIDENNLTRFDKVKRKGKGKGKNKGNQPPHEGQPKQQPQNNKGGKGNGQPKNKSKRQPVPAKPKEPKSND